MNTKSIILVLALCLSTITVACPGSRYRSDEHQQYRMSFLNLSEGQKIEFKKIMTSKKERMQQAMKSIHEESIVELSKVLTDEQMETLKSQKQEHRRGHKSRRKSH